MNEQDTLRWEPVRREGDNVVFADGRHVHIVTIAREWGDMQRRLYGGLCINPECGEPAVIELSVFGHSVGRVCARCRPAVQGAEED